MKAVSVMLWEVAPPMMQNSFQDYILSQNDYTMPAGEHVKVSNTFDYVYADDLGNLYVSNTQEQPAGTTQLHPN